mmetsp:Transcript_65344/g.156069  ORF Transcript_65344/g.156069 Transcript_65344/m.156069 type:complete len:220 (+) Transcript_65344:352-1011(+)
MGERLAVSVVRRRPEEGEILFLPRAAWANLLQVLASQQVQDTDYTACRSSRRQCSKTGALKIGASGKSPADEERPGFGQSPTERTAPGVPPAARHHRAGSPQEPGLLQEAQAGQRLGLPILRLRARLITEAGGGEGAETAQGVLADYGWSEVPLRRRRHQGPAGDGVDGRGNRQAVLGGGGHQGGCVAAERLQRRSVARLWRGGGIREGQADCAGGGWR